MAKTIKSALSFLVFKEAEKGLYGFEGYDGDIVSWQEVLSWINKVEVKADASNS